MSDQTIWLMMTSFLGAALVPMALIDIRDMRIPNWLNLAIALLGAIATALLARDWIDATLGALLGYGTLWLVNAWVRARRGYDGIGMGDAKLLAALGIWTGWSGLPFILLIASTLGLVFVFAARLVGTKFAMTSRIPFGPFIGAAGLTVWILHHTYFAEAVSGR